MVPELRGSLGRHTLYGIELEHTPPFCCSSSLPHTAHTVGLSLPSHCTRGAQRVSLFMAYLPDARRDSSQPPNLIVPVGSIKVSDSCQARLASRARRRLVEGA
jgi:hypothetical protein